MDLPLLARFALLGVAAGGRSQTPFAVLARTATPGGRLGLLASRGVVVGTTVAAVGELVGDKLPQTPSRLSPAGFVPRLIIGAGAAAVLSARTGASEAEVGVAAALGAAGAAAGSYAGAAWRRLAAGWLGLDLPGALLEDAAVVGLAVAATNE
jgi:uncharacterized membrane protein